MSRISVGSRGISVGSLAEHKEFGRSRGKEEPIDPIRQENNKNTLIVMYIFKPIS